MTLAIFGILMAMLSQVLILNLNTAKKISQRSQVRDEVSQVVGLLQRDLRNANSITDCITQLTGAASCTVDVAGQTYLWVNSSASNICKQAANNGEAICKMQGREVLFVSGDIINVASLRFDSNVSNGRGRVLATIEIEARNEAWDVKAQVRQISVSTRNF